MLVSMPHSTTMRAMLFATTQCKLPGKVLPSTSVIGDTAELRGWRSQKHSLRPGGIPDAVQQPSSELPSWRRRFPVSNRQAAPEEDFPGSSLHKPDRTVYLTVARGWSKSGTEITGCFSKLLNTPFYGNTTAIA